MTERNVLDPYTGEPAELLFVAKDNRGKPGAFTYYRGASGHVFIESIPPNLVEYYEGGYQRIPQSEAELATLAAGDAYRLEPIKRLVPQGDFLEIGPWIGLVSYSAMKAGYRTHALERDPRCISLMRSVGIDAQPTDDPARWLAETVSSYDAIGLWHSIEHLPRPWEVLDAAAKRLNPGGILLVAGPNPDSAQMKILGKKWVHLDAPRHIHFLPIAMVEEIGSRNGLITVEKTTDDQLGDILDRQGWDWEANRLARNIPGLRGIAHRLFPRRWARTHRKPGALDGAGYTVVMKRPKDS